LISIRKLKGHATLWWDMLQKDRVNNQMERIRTWKKMVTKIKEKLFMLITSTIFSKKSRTSDKWRHMFMNTLKSYLGCHSEHASKNQNSKELQGM
jgi:hypothetical protein